MIAILEAYRVGLLKSRYYLPNLMAGIIVGIVALPLAMAFAIASGVLPQQGLYTAIVAGLVVGLLGGTRVQIAGPTGAFIVILAGITAKYGVGGLQIATLLAGVMLLLMGLLKFGNVIKFIPDPVIVGFTSGIGVIIFVGEWKDFFGLSFQLPLDAPFYQKFWAVIQHLPAFNTPTTILAFLSLFLLMIGPRFLKRIPAPLVTLLVVTVLESYFRFDGVATIGSVFGKIPSNLPSFSFPSFNLNQLLSLLGPAFTIALLGAIESLLSASVADGLTGYKHHSNQELIGQGIANMLTPLFGGFAATGAIARTATNIRHGANSPIAAVVHSLTLILIIILLAPLAVYIPLCSLAAILFIVAYNMSDIPHFIHIAKHAPRYDVIVLLITFLLTVLTDLVIAVNVGVILAMVFFIRRMNQSTKIEIQDAETLAREFNEHKFLTKLPLDIIVFNLQGPIFFGVVEKVERALLATNTDPKIIILRLKNVPFMDITGLETLNEVVQQFHKRGVKVYLTEANERVKYKLLDNNLVQWVADNKVYDSFMEVFIVSLD